MVDSNGILSQAEKCSRPRVGWAKRSVPTTAAAAVGTAREERAFAHPTGYQFGNANTHSTEPPSGFCISGVSVASALEWLDPLPTATATYCLPLTL
jgi:hypothetical protein